MSTLPDRTNYFTGSPFEPLRGYSRAVKVGNHLFISGTTAIKEKGDVEAPGDAYAQTKFVIGRIKLILQKAGFSIGDVVRTRLFITNMSQWDAYARAHREAFELVRPASSIVQVAKLVDTRLVLEMEVEAIKQSGEVESATINLNDLM